MAPLTTLVLHVYPPYVLFDSGLLMSLYLFLVRRRCNVYGNHISLLKCTVRTNRRTTASLPDAWLPRPVLRGTDAAQKQQMSMRSDHSAGRI